MTEQLPPEDRRFNPGHYLKFSELDGSPPVDWTETLSRIDRWVEVSELAQQCKLGIIQAADRRASLSVDLRKNLHLHVRLPAWMSRIVIGWLKFRTRK